MSEEKLLTVRDVSIILGLTEKQVMDLAETGSLPAYKIGGLYLRFKKEQIEEFRKSTGFLFSKPAPDNDYPFKDRINDFLYFNDFYILAILIIILLFIIIFRGY
jgi:excisionase family DNA binding protein